MKMTMRVEYASGETADVTVSPLAIIGWEKWSGRKMTDLGGSGSGVGMGDMVRMAWEQTKLTGLTNAEYEDWAATLADIDVVEKENPTFGSEEA